MLSVGLGPRGSLIAAAMKHSGDLHLATFWLEVEMASVKRVVVQGGGANLYKIDEYSGWFYACHVKVGFISNSNSSIGKTRSRRDALELIKVHSGKEIESVE